MSDEYEITEARAAAFRRDLKKFAQITTVTTVLVGDHVRVGWFTPESGVADTTSAKVVGFHNGLMVADGWDNRVVVTRIEDIFSIQILDRPPE